MKIKMTGYEHKVFLESPKYFPINAYYEYEERFINGVLDNDHDDDLIKEADIVEYDADATICDSNDDRELKVQFNEWKRKRKHSTYAIDVPKNMAKQQLKKILSEFKIKLHTSK